MLGNEYGKPLPFVHAFACTAVLLSVAIELLCRSLDLCVWYSYAGDAHFKVSFKGFSAGIKDVKVRREIL